MASKIDWTNLRYRGDAADVDELMRDYRIENFLNTVQETQRQMDQSARDQFLRNGIRLTEQLSPRIFNVYRQVCRNLERDTEAEVYCIPSPEINAVAVLDCTRGADRALIGVTSAALEKLEDSELASILGHELGHFLFDNHRLNALINRDPNSPSATVLPPLGESVFLRWRKKSEISADRVGAVAARDGKAAARALLKATFGLGDKNLNLDIDALLKQIDDLRGKPELMSATFESHPLLPIRLKALDLFCKSQKAIRAGYPCAVSDPMRDDALEAAIDELMLLTRRYPFTPIAQAVMKAVTMGGVYVLAADGDISEHEIKILILVLHRFFTDEPEKEIITDAGHVQLGLAQAIAEINRIGTSDDKVFVISRLADIALADGALMGDEGAIILKIAAELQIPERVALNIMVGAASSVGFRVDTKLNQVAEEVRKSLRIGLGYGTAGAVLSGSVTASPASAPKA